jgi:hypothetical protein
MSTSTELVKPGPESEYSVLQMTRQEVTDLLSEALAPGEKLSAGDLIRVKVPTGGMTKWVVPNPALGNDDVLDELVGVPLRIGTQRGYWHKKFSGGNEQPDCSSDDGYIGTSKWAREDPSATAPAKEDKGAVPWRTNPCEDCPFNEFGTAVGDAEGGGLGKACKEVRQVFLLPPNSILPICVNVTPGSLAVFKAFRVSLLNGGLKATDVEVALQLDKAENAGGIVFAKVIPRITRRLDPEAAAAMRQLAAVVAPQMDRAAAVMDATEVGA